MAQSGFTPIQLYFSTTASAAPSAGNLANGELALNITDGKLFYKDNGGVVQVLATKAGASGNVVGPASSTDNALVRFDTTTGKLVQNSVGILDDSGNLTGIAALTTSGALTLNGGTANGVAYLNGSKVLTTGSALTFNGSNTLTIDGGATGYIVGPSGEMLIGEDGSGLYVGGGFGATPAIPVIYGTTGTTHHRWNANGGEQMRLTSTGLGIGTSSPNARVTSKASGNAYTNGALALVGSVSGTSYLTNVGGTFYISNDGSTDHLVMSSSGNLGLGVTPSAWSLGAGQAAFQFGRGSLFNNSANNTYLNANLFYDGASNRYIVSAAAAQYGMVGGQHHWYTAPVGVAGNAISFTQAMTLDASGRLGIGTTSPGSYNGSADDLVIAGSSNTGMTIRSTSGVANIVFSNAEDSGVDGLIQYDPSSNFMRFDTNGSERARIDSSGNLLVGTTSYATTPASGVTIQTGFNASVNVGHNNSPSGFLFVNFGYNSGQIGSITQAGTTGVLYNITSDYRLKNVIGAVDGQGERIDALEPIEYEWKSDGSRTRGFLAHKFQEVYPGSVSGEKDAVDADGKPVYQTMQASTSEVIADLVAEIKSLRVRIAALEGESN